VPTITKRSLREGHERSCTVDGREVAPSCGLRILRALILALALVNLSSCATISRHLFAEPARDWEARNGQLLYRTAKTTLIGEVLVRFSKAGEFELTFSKGPGVTLFTLRQDASFAQIKGALVHGGWSGPTANAPNRLRGWLGLRDELMRSQDKQTVRYVSGPETFIFHF
jgi:hypothetical protein